jgi:hypothetical protein
MHRRDFLFLLAASPLVTRGSSYLPAGYSKLVYPDKSGRLIYSPDENGNTIPDFSNCGYMGGGVKLPEVPVRITIDPVQSDAVQQIQAAIDKVAKMPPDKNGIRGAVLMKRGVYKLNEPLRISTGGIVLRGESQNESGAVLVATKRQQHALINVAGQGPGKAISAAVRILDDYIPVGAHSFRLESVKGLHVGDNVIVRRIGNKEWIHEIAMDRITPRPSGGTQQWQPFNLDYERIITDIKGDRITIDAPIVCAIEQRWGGGEVYTLDKSQRIQNVGIENLRGDSEFDASIIAETDDKKEKYHADEQHGWDFIKIEAAENVWVKNITAVHFGYSAVNIGDAKWVTVQDSKCVDMVSQITGSRRYCFNIDGQQNLVQRCEADTGRHSFVVGGRVRGPNAFLFCKATTNYATSEPHHRWSTGGLYDNVVAPMAIQDRQYMGSGHGWAGANYVVWNCEGPLVCQRPPTAQNWAIGQIGEKQAGAFAPRPDGYWESLGQHVLPRSLYLQQLKDRLGDSAMKNIS